MLWPPYCAKHSLIAEGEPYHCLATRIVPLFSETLFYSALSASLDIAQA